jgi:lipopolysaccharide export system permease protein
LLMMMFSLLGELRDTGGSYGTADVFWFVLQTGPRSAYQIFPVSALMGSLLGIGALASANELVAFRTAGVSRLRLAAAGMAGALLLTIPVMAIGEWIAPGAEQQARAFRLSQLVGQVIIGGPSGMWMRDGNDIVNIRRPILTADRGEQSISFQDVQIFSFNGFSGLQKITHAESASFDGEQWTLENVFEAESET